MQGNIVESEIRDVFFQEGIGIALGDAGTVAEEYRLRSLFLEKCRKRMKGTKVRKRDWMAAAADLLGISVQTLYVSHRAYTAFASGKQPPVYARMAYNKIKRQSP